MPSDLVISWVVEDFRTPDPKISAVGQREMVVGL